MKKESKKGQWNWIWTIVIFAIIYLTGYHTEVIGQLQRGILATGLLNPSVEPIQKNEKTTIDLNKTNFTMQELNSGSVKSLLSYSGKILFINIWATWCPPCRAEMPGIQDLYNEFENSSDIQFIMLSVDDDPNIAHKFIDNKNFTFPVFTLTMPLPKELQSNSIPTTFIINQEGEIILKHEGMANYSSKKFKNYLRGLTL
ncbi:TlpA family protein disulfide reductase [Membranihabitans maritimus]|uniref:TlpA family protein disulfide reductase n=1 Tax=Membranihabitans maritimus TaxID=2904244 RepID=UPI001F3A8AF0|nr:TlpA disulfide reductase family protein [Membranihabitans maritimus]